MSREDDTSSRFHSQLCCRPMAPIRPFSIFPSSPALSKSCLPMFRSEIGEVLSDHQLSFDLDQ